MNLYSYAVALFLRGNECLAADGEIDRLHTDGNESQANSNDGGAPDDDDDCDNDDDNINECNVSIYSKR